MSDASNPTGECFCGCRKPTPIAKQNHRKSGHIRGEPVRYLPGHSSRKPLSNRFWSSVDVDGNLAGCWLWVGEQNSGGYGTFSYMRDRVRKRHLSHRLMYQLLVGEMPPGLQLDHLCRVRTCVNPDHLEPVTQAENIRRGAAGATARAVRLAKTHCPSGHSLAGDNLYVTKEGWRQCKACRRNHAHSYKERLRSQRAATAASRIA